MVDLISIILHPSSIIHHPSSTQINIAFNISSGPANSNLILSRHHNHYPFLKPICILFKYYLQIRSLSDPWTGGIGSYLASQMILSFFQCHPCIPRVRVDGNGKLYSSSSVIRHPSSTLNLGTLWMDFLHYYAHDVNPAMVVISTVKNGSLSQRLILPDSSSGGGGKSAALVYDIKKLDRLCVRDPYCPCMMMDDG